MLHGLLVNHELSILCDKSGCAPVKNLPVLVISSFGSGSTRSAVNLIYYNRCRSANWGFLPRHWERSEQASLERIDFPLPSLLLNVGECQTRATVRGCCGPGGGCIRILIHLLLSWVVFDKWHLFRIRLSRLEFRSLLFISEFEVLQGLIDGFGLNSVK